MNFEAIVKYNSRSRIFSFNEIIHQFMAFLNIILIKLLLSLFSLQQSYFSLELSILFFKSSDNDSRINGFITKKVILNESNTHCEFTCGDRLQYILLFWTHCGDHACLTVATQRIPQNHRHQRFSIGNVDILSSSFFIKLNNDSLKVMKAQIDIDGFLLQQTLHACLLDSLRT